MKVARLVVLGVALATGGIAAFAVAGGAESRPLAAAPPEPKFETFDLPVANSGFGVARPLGAAASQCQAWSAAATAESTHLDSA